MDKLTQYLNAHPHDELHPSEIANILKDLDDKGFSEAIQAIPKELIADVALELPDRYTSLVSPSANTATDTNMKATAVTANLLSKLSFDFIVFRF